MIIGCKCGKHKEIYREPDYEYGQYYIKIECIPCNYYWEGYYGICIEDKEEEQNETN